MAPYKSVYYYYFLNIFIPQVVKIPGEKIKKLKSKCRMLICPAGQLALSCKSTELKRCCYYYYYYLTDCGFLVPATA